MPTFQWRENLRLGHPEVDRQHLEIIARVNLFQGALDAGEGQDRLVALFDDLDQYARSHFQLEERLMEQHGYPGLNAHRAEHARFMARVAGFRSRLLQREAGLPRAVLRYLEEWLVQHLAEVDTAMVQFLRAARRAK
ncbi:MAG TPA: bacteriohemerythrin [Myxococcota bacterium]|nr:bacteriohemerythrin [Myxococcota bacterium]HRY94732.1 bacteriohemerythrin [Myxococcota bacterium]HSA20045.1 bacteriohemerythrin [Myxococcota bacterium]